MLSVLPQLPQRSIPLALSNAISAPQFGHLYCTTMLALPPLDILPANDYITLQNVRRKRAGSFSLADIS
jgi:hypothetical protein